MNGMNGMNGKKRTNRRTAWARWPLLALAAAGAATLTTGTATADEHYDGTTLIGPRYGLLVTGQIDDPLEDVLEHAAIFGSHTVTND
ncbi:hypothetical protein [Streptomyces sp. 6N223]|uniref:hypothetical protein n=1 Tax=Streptomyces sp. 6N223 TaxID=3457412 RepID=UPI003FD4ECC3